MKFCTQPEIKELVVAWDLQIYVSDAKDKIWNLIKDLHCQGLRICDVDFRHPLRLISGGVIDNRLTNKMRLTLRECWDKTLDMDRVASNRMVEFFSNKVVPDPVEDVSELMFPK